MDIRAIDDLGREAVIYDLSKRIYQICDKRSVSCIIEHKVWSSIFVFQFVFLLIFGSETLGIRKSHWILTNPSQAGKTHLRGTKLSQRLLFLFTRLEPESLLKGNQTLCHFN